MYGGDAICCQITLSTCDKFTAESVLKEFLKQLNMSQSYGEKVDCLKHPERRALTRDLIYTS